MTGLDPLTCIVCGRQVDPMSDEAEGWVLVPHSSADGDEHDDSQWKCAACVSVAERLNYGDKSDDA